MFIRQKKNPSGLVSIQVIDKSAGKYKVYKELERILKATGFDLSVDKALSIAKTITTVRIKLIQSGADYGQNYASN